MICAGSVSLVRGRAGGVGLHKLREYCDNPPSRRGLPCRPFLLAIPLNGAISAFLISSLATLFSATEEFGASQGGRIAGGGLLQTRLKRRAIVAEDMHD